MEDEKEQIDLMEKPSIRSETSESYTSNNTSGYASDSNGHDDNSGTQSRELARSSTVDKLSNQLSRLTARGPPTSNVASVSTFSDAAKHEVNSVSEKLHDHKRSEISSNSTGSLDLPSPPKDSPNNDKDSDPVSAAATDTIDSKSSQTSLDSYRWSLAASDLPSWTLNDDEEKNIWPLQNKFSFGDKFEENNHYRVSVEIGDGAFGKCYLAVEVPRDDTTKGRVFCVKMCQYRINELLALRLAREENIAEIIEFYGATIKGKDVRIFMKFMAGGTISGLIQEKKKPSSSTDTDVHDVSWPIICEMDGLSYLEDVLKAVKFLHAKGIVHRDIKGENVLLDENRLCAKLADFGSAENIMGAGPSIDIWKTGCLLLEMLNGKRPPLLIDEGTLQRQNSCKPEDYIPIQAMRETKELLRFLFATDRNYPPTAAEVLELSHAFPVKKLLKRLDEQLQSSEKLG